VLLIAWANRGNYKTEFAKKLYSFAPNRVRCSNLARVSSRQDEHNMDLNLSGVELDRLVENAKQLLRDQGDALPTDNELRRAIARVVESRIELIAEELPDRFSDVRSAEFRALQQTLDERFLREAKKRQPLTQDVPAEQPATILTGQRPFFPARLEAMIEYITYAGKNVFQTNLNKLLFYSDFAFFHLTNTSISGATYARLPQGPVYPAYREILDAMESADKLTLERINTRGMEARLLKSKSSYDPAQSILSEDEKRVLDWVVRKLGDLTSGQISEISHEEIAYKNTPPGAPISYTFAETLKILPPPNILD
jgi:uncharacterized phage-associated protein